MPSAAPESGERGEHDQRRRGDRQRDRDEAARAAQMRGEQQRDGDRAERRLPFGLAQEARVDRVELGLDRDDADAGTSAIAARTRSTSSGRVARPAG